MKKVKQVLLIYPETPPSFWGFRQALKFLGKRESMPPLGLITVAAMFPKSGYELKLIDMNVSHLRDADIKQADIVLVSAMIVHAKSLKEIIARCNNIGRPVIVGGPYATSYSDIVKDMGATCLVIGEAEGIFSQLLADWEDGELKECYQSSEYPDVAESPLPRFDLLKLKAYATMAIQFSRGCPWDCEFCDITKMFGKNPRTKTAKQVLAEFEFLYKLGWRGSIFLVDDNLIGNRKAVEQLLPEIIAWQKSKGYPFSFFTEASINLASMENVMDMMVEARFNTVFIGIESPKQETLKIAGKDQNVGIDLLQALKTIREHGLMVYLGFIIGLDGDGPEIFDNIVNFIRKAKVPIAMVGFLGVLRGTDLYNRLKRENRLRGDVATGSNTDLTAINFIPQMNEKVLVDGYEWVIATLYDPTLRDYFERCWGQIEESENIRYGRSKISLLGKARVVIYSIRYQLFNKKHGSAYRQFLWRVICYHPKMFGCAIALAIKGYDLQDYTRSVLDA